MPLYHATKVTSRQRACVTRANTATRVNLCGAELTIGDLPIRDFRACVRDAFVQPATGATHCPACARILASKESP